MLRLVIGVCAILIGFVTVFDVVSRLNLKKEYEGKLWAVSEQLEKQKKASDLLEDQIALLRLDRDQLIGDLNNEVAKNDVYRKCVVPATGVRLLQRAIDGSAAK